MARSLTGRQREAAKRKLATKRGTQASLITDEQVYSALDAGQLTLADCTPSGSDTGSSGHSSHDYGGYSGGGYDSGSSASSSGGDGGSY